MLHSPSDAWLQFVQNAYRQLVSMSPLALVPSKLPAGRVRYPQTRSH